MEKIEVLSVSAGRKRADRGRLSLACGIVHRAEIAGRNVCPDCGIRLIRLGSCFTCPVCGWGGCG